MAELNILEFLDFNLDRAKSVNTDGESLSDSELMTITEVKEKDFGVDLVYFNEDENTGNSFPAVFLKNISNFSNPQTLKDIAETQRKIWNYKKVLFLYVYSDTEIRIYNCSEKPLIKKQNLDYEKELQRIEVKGYTFSDKKQLEELNRLFSRIAIDSGIVWTLEEAQAIRNKIKLQRRVDKYLVESLVNTANQLEQQGLKIEFIHKIILRSLFLLYLEDRGATNERLYSQIKKEAESYFDILDDVEATYLLYERLDEDFNGNVFAIEKDENISKEQLQLIKKCFISGNDNTPQTQLFEKWRLFDFSIIQIELLSEIYENFLFRTDPEQKKKTGTYYTPPALVDFILNEKLPVNKTDNDYNVKVLDPSCGSGIFLVQSFKRLVKRYENKHKEKLTDFNKLQKILTDNIFGIELHAQAIKVAAFSLYLALVDCLDPKTLWQKKNHRLPFLINNPNDKSLKKQGYNLYCRDTIDQNKEIESIKFDLIVGNPPFGTRDLSESIRNYVDRYDFAKEMVLPFLHKATRFAPNGEIAMIFNTKVLTNTGQTYQNFRKWLFNNCYVEKVFNFSILRNPDTNFERQLFDGATGPISIVYYQKEWPENPRDKIVYYAPKTFIKSNVIDGMSIDFTDLKYLPREECQKPNTKIWKIAMWGGMNDWELINRVSKKFNISIGGFLKKNKEDYHFGSGLHAPSKKQLKENKTFTPSKVINLRKVQRYYTLKSAEKFSKKVFRSINQNIFNPPYLIIKEGQKNKKLCASWIDYKSYHTGALSISPINHQNNFKLKLWCSLINSSFAKYYLALTSASWGVERERIQANEMLALPMPTNINMEILLKLEKKFDKLVEFIKDDFDYTKTKCLELELDEIILQDMFLFSESDKWIIEDLINYSIDLFENKANSIALYPVLEKQTIDYAKNITAELNSFLDSQELFVNAKIYNISRFSPLMMIKLCHNQTKKEVEISNEQVDDELQKLDKHLWQEKSMNIYFRKKLNYKTEDGIYIIRPNQRRFWSQSMALDDASELILEILNGIHDEA